MLSRNMFRIYLYLSSLYIGISYKFEPLQFFKTLWGHSSSRFYESGICIDDETGVKIVRKRYILSKKRTKSNIALDLPVQLTVISTTFSFAQTYGFLLKWLS